MSIKYCDLHFHVGPDDQQRKYNSKELADLVQATDGWAVLKSHVTPTVCMGWWLRRQGFPISGSVVLNWLLDDSIFNYLRALSDLNLDNEGKRLIVYLPTRFLNTEVDKLLFDAGYNLTNFGRELIKECANLDIVLATGHMSGPRINSVVEEYLHCDGRRLLITHATHPMVGLNTDAVIALGSMEGVFIELTALTYTLNRAPFVESVLIWEKCPNLVFSSDFGQTFNDGPEQWLAIVSKLAMEANLDEDRVIKAIRDTPLRLIS